jgi:hypothetical protein
VRVVCDFLSCQIQNIGSTRGIPVLPHYACLFETIRRDDNGGSDGVVFLNGKSVFLSARLTAIQNCYDIRTNHRKLPLYVVPKPLTQHLCTRA